MDKTVEIKSSLGLVEKIFEVVSVSLQDNCIVIEKANGTLLVYPWTSVSQLTLDKKLLKTQK